MASPWRRSRAARALLLAVLLILMLQAAPPAQAIGPAISLSVTPPAATGAPDLGMSGDANFSGEVNLFADPIGQATIVVEITAQYGWLVRPSSFSWSSRSPERFPFNFTVEVPPNATADSSALVEVVASYRVGGITTQTETATVNAVAGAFYGGSARRVTPPAVMEPGKRYVVEYTLQNEGNAAATFALAWGDSALMSKLRAATELPPSVSLGAFDNETIQIFVTPGGTTPGGSYEVPVRVELKDRSGVTNAFANFSIAMEFNNLPIYQGILPNWNLQGPYTFLAFLSVFLTLWFALQFTLALFTSRRLDPAGGPRLPRALGVRLRRSLLTRSIRRVLGRVPRGRPRAVKRPDEVRGLARSRADRGR